MWSAEINLQQVSKPSTQFTVKIQACLMADPVYSMDPRVSQNDIKMRNLIYKSECVCVCMFKINSLTP
jgi:hypothetical protein